MRSPRSPLLRRTRICAYARRRAPARAGVAGGKEIQEAGVTTRPADGPSTGVKLTCRIPSSSDTPPSPNYLMQHQGTDRTSPWHEDESRALARRVIAPRSPFAFRSTTRRSTTRREAACLSRITSPWYSRGLTSSTSLPTFTVIPTSRSCPWAPSATDSKKPRVRLATLPGFSEEGGGLRVGAQVPPNIQGYELVTGRFVFGDTAPLRSTCVSVPDSESGIALIDGQRVSPHTSGEGVR